MNRVRLLGDHSRYHAGGWAAFHGIKRILKENGWQIAHEDRPYDVLVMNGEGSMHDGWPDFHKKMREIEEALSRGKRAYLVNTVWQNNPSDYDDVLRSLSGITVREKLSQTDLLERHGISSTVLADTSMYAPLPFISRRKNFRSRPAHTDFYFPETNSFGSGVTLPADARHLKLRWSWGRVISSLKTASYLITGRQHGVYAACRARIPFAASEGNTHKIKGLIASSGTNIPVAKTPFELAAIIPRLPDLQPEFEKLFSWLEIQDYRSMLPMARE